MKTLHKILTVILLLATLCATAQKAAPKSAAKSDTPLVDPKTNCMLRYYYYPNLEAYFDIQKKLYYYKQDGAWTKAEEIPDGYHGYSLYNKVSVMITDYDDEDPTQFVDQHKKKFPYITRNGQRKMTASAE